MGRITIVLAAMGVLCATAADAKVPTATAVRVQARPPRIDGVLDEAVWQRAPVHARFRQRDPDEGRPATEGTSFQVAYDEEALYVAVRCEDSEPERIVARLTRRDGDTEADWVRVSLDPRLDHQTGFWFSVYASGSVVDGTYARDLDMEPGWDGVWEVATVRDEAGWTAEYRIPYHVLRFAPREEYVWGLNVERHISRKQERDQWSLVKRGDSGLVSRFGRLEGIRGVDPPLHLEVAPYGRGRTIVDDGSDAQGAVGADVRYGLSSSTSLTATINPDFGQVDADPATLNLTAFEDFFDERRPFFVEGASIFDIDGFDVFYSRRIGRRPGYLSLPAAAAAVTRPEATTIEGAVKVTGKARGRTTFGALAALTAPEHARFTQVVDGAPVRQRQLVEPRTGYFVGRLRQDVLDGTSTMGAMATAVERGEGASAYVGALDWDLRFDRERYGVSGALIGTRTGADAGRHNGAIGRLEFAKRGGCLESFVGAATESRHADLNDLGYLRRGDLRNTWADFTYYRHTPLGPFQRFDINLGGNADWNTDGLRLATSVNVSQWYDTRSYWRVHVHTGRDFEAYDDDDVLRGGPVIRRLAHSWVHAQVETDARRKVRFKVRPEWKRQDGGRSHTRGLRLGFYAQPTPSVSLSVEPSYSREHDDAQWVGVLDGHFVYGELTSRTLDFTTRGSVAFTPDLTVELYLQPFVAIGDYDRFKELAAQESYRFEAYQLGESRDFHRRSLRSNLVLRWEYRPGSLIYLVWSQSRSAAPEPVTDGLLELRPLKRLRQAFTDDGGNVFLVKVGYWYGR